MPLRKRRLVVAALSLGIFLALLLPYLRPRPTPRYTVTDLGVLPGDSKSRAYGINAQGQVCGFTQNLSKQACVFDGVVVTPLGRVAPGSESIARDINAQGDVTGTTGQAPASQAFVWSHGRMRLLGTLPGFTSSGGLAMNAQGDVAGRAHNPSRPNAGQNAGQFEDAFLCNHGKMTDLGALLGGTNSRAHSINSAGQVVGESDFRPGRVKFSPFLYDSRTKTMSLLPMPPPYIYGFANHVNEVGQVAGDVSSGGTDHAVLWSGGQLTDLGVPAGFGDSDAEGLNKQGVVVGRCFLEDNAAHTFLQGHVGSDNFLKRYLDRETQRAFVAQNGKIQVLDDLVPADADWTLIEASAVNDRGQIAGYGLHHGQERAFLLTPVR